jgi:hypothetical protein
MASKKHERFEFEKIKKKAKEEFHHDYNSIVGFLGLLIRTLSPLSYKKLCHGDYGEGFRYFFHVLVFSFLLFSIFTVPQLVGFYDQLRSETEHLNNFSLTPQLDVDQVISFDDFGIVVANDKTYDGELLLITQDSLSWPDERCLFVEPSCFLYNDPDELDFSRANELVEDREKFAQVAFAFVLLMLPGIFVLLFAYFLVKYLIFVFLFFLVGYVWCLVLRMEIHIRQLILNAIYALSITMIVQTVFGFYYQTYYIPHIGSFVIFLIGTYIVADKPFHHFKGHGK